MRSERPRRRRAADIVQMPWAQLVNPLPPTPLISEDEVEAIHEAALTLLIAMFLIMGGVFRFLVAFSAPFQIRIWLMLHGAINFFLGISIWQQMPFAGLWVIGLFVGIDMFCNGISLILLAMAVKKIPQDN